jgi:hypothetical protein
MKKIFHLSPLGLYAVLTLAGAPAMADDTGPGDLLRELDPASGAAAAAAETPLPPKVKAGRNRLVGFDAGQLQADRIRLNLFEDTALIAERDRIVDQGQGHTVWVGHIQGEPGSEVILAREGDALTGTVKRENRQVYTIEYQGGEAHAVRQLDPRKTLPHVDPLPPPPPEPGSETPEAVPDESQLAPALPAEGNSIVDLLVVYTPKAKANAGGAAGIESKIRNAVEAANQAYINSQVQMRLNLVHMAEIQYTESGDMSATLSDLRNKGDGKLEAAHTLRDQYGADQVALISADGGYCGIAYVMTQVGNSFASNAFAVVHDDSQYNCLGSQTLAHELGHNQGNAHDRANSSSPGAYPYSYGHRVCGSGGFKTVMAYSCSGANGISYFANPSVQYNGKATGIDPNTNASQSAADAWSMNNTRATVAAWRQSKNGGGGDSGGGGGGGGTATIPAAPGGLTATAPASDRITLGWTDASNNESGFKVERSLDGSTWSEIASLGANVQSYTNTGLSPKTAYSYRVQSYNSAGESAFSNVASATTPGSTTTGGGSDSAAPVVKFTRPTNGARVSYYVPVVATATDDVGVTSLKLYIDGRLAASTSADTLTYNWIAYRAAAGNHTLEAVATDGSGKTGRSSITVRK